MARVLEQVDILDNIPPVVANTYEMRAIATAENIELNKLYKMLYDLMSDQFVYEATEIGIRRWEKMLGIQPMGDLESRRFTILNRLNVRIPYTWRMLQERMSSLFGNDYKMSIDNDTSTLFVEIPNVDGVLANETKTMLEVIIPANLVLDFRVRGDVKWTF